MSDEDDDDAELALFVEQRTQEMREAVKEIQDLTDRILARAQEVVDGDHLAP